jgi:hypothetical protein
MPAPLVAITGKQFINGFAQQQRHAQTNQAEQPLVALLQHVGKQLASVDMALFAR